MRKCVIGFIASVYAIQAYLLLSGEAFDVKLLLLLTVPALIMGCVNIAAAAAQIPRAAADVRRQRRLNHWTLGLKLALIPFFCLNFLLWSSISALLLLFPGGILVAPVLVIIATIFAYAMMLPSSVYAIAGLIVQRRAGRLTSGYVVRHVLLQLLFVLDVVSMIFIHRRVRKKMKEEETG